LESFIKVSGVEAHIYIQTHKFDTHPAGRTLWERRGEREKEKEELGIDVSLDNNNNNSIASQGHAEKSSQGAIKIHPLY